MDDRTADIHAHLVDHYFCTIVWRNSQLKILNYLFEQYQGNQNCSNLDHDIMLDEISSVPKRTNLSHLYKIPRYSTYWSTWDHHALVQTEVRP